ncbi:hypothetical protein CDL15_Pgr012395 [Punica granatum]|uniref:Uncharacterized protein n=1 Tax=Punica granatum TaxID=22663 RepID=A0A218W2N3_PUNGR|nr:hypothetical protein CDL15_Pgr012395 [Punica granatum]
MREKQGPIGKAQKPAKGEDKQQTSKRRKPALWHYSSPDHRSVRRYPIWDFKNPSWYQNDQWHLRVHFRSLLPKSEHSRTFADAFLTGLPGRPIHGQVNGTQKRACIYPRTTRTMEQVLNCLSRLVLVSRVSPDPAKGPFQMGSSAQSSFGGKWTFELHPTHSLQLLGLGKSFRLGPSKSVRSPE